VAIITKRSKFIC